MVELLRDHITVFQQDLYFAPTFFKLSLGVTQSFLLFFDLKKN